MSETFDKPLHIGKPSWLKTKIPTGETFFEIKEDLRSKNIATVCEEAKCPNIGECWNTRTATFMILGDTCTRGCRFCHVKTGNPAGLLDPEEPAKVAHSCQIMKLNYVVLTMVDRDDLEDGGSKHAAQVVSQIKLDNPGIRVEFLAGDFQGRLDSVQALLDAGLNVYAHNLETVRRLTPRVRDRRATYERSLMTLEKAKELAQQKIFTKSALMLGLGETHQEVLDCLKDMRSAGVDFVTIGQYMRPTKKHLPIKEWVHPNRFQQLAEEAKSLGFLSVASAPLVRSSYKAREFYDLALGTAEAPGRL